MERQLIIANQTLGGAALDHEIDARVRNGNDQFFVVVPMLEPEHEVFYLSPRDPAYGIPAATLAEADALEMARQRSQGRLDALLDRVRSTGGVAEGMIGDADPYNAVKRVVDREPFSEIIISTLPTGISRWVKMDLPSRVERLVDCKVTVVEGELVEY